PAINEPGIKLNKLRARLKFLPRRFCVANSTGSDHRNCGLCNNIAHERGGFFTQGRPAQTAFLVELWRNWRMVESRVRRDDPCHSVFFTYLNNRCQLDRREIR